MNLADRSLPRPARRGAIICSIVCSIICSIVCTRTLRAQDLPWSERMANSAMQRWPDGRGVPPDAALTLDIKMSMLLQGIEAVRHNTASGDDLKYIQGAVDPFIPADGSTIRSYDLGKYGVDDVLFGRQLLLLYAATHDSRYLRAARILRLQLALQPRTPEGGFWHGANYPQQMGLDNLYMIEPFYAEYAHTFHEPADFADITKQFVLTEAHLRDPKTGLLYPMWDEARDEPWADKTTGDSPVLWSRAMGWCMMALVDTIPYYEPGDPGRAKLLAILNRLAAAIVRYQDPASGLWYQVTDRPKAPGNYLESSAACMFAYALAKAVREGYLPAHYFASASRAYQGILKQFITVDADGSVNLTGTVSGVGLTPELTRENSYAYYVSTPVISNDPKTVGEFIMASVEIETAAHLQRRTVHRKPAQSPGTGN